ncbi:sensor histidine kinase [Eubacteriales bacterium OttesenSCG-928-A19]|nr:sensor histidine kinase [Eubacteriales bacterium OttesenSCG-928-A19]
MNRRQRPPRQREEHLHTSPFGAVTLLLLAAGTFALGHLLLTFLYHFTGTPPAIVTSVLSGMLGLLIFVLGSRLVMTVYRRRMGDVPHHQGRGRMLEETIAAMDRIARGDFSVLLQSDAHDPFSGLAESVNRMARELGSMESLRQDFISNVSHEIQSPLTSISGFTELLKNDALPPEQRAHYLKVIETEAKRLSGLSDNLLKLSTLESHTQPPAMKAFRLDKQIQNAVLMLEPQWVAKNLNLSLELEKVNFTGDEPLLSQVWINLLHNAIKFTPENGEIMVTLSGNVDAVTVRVADSGVGISAEDRPHIFERFYKADKARDRSLGGNGLGLSLVKKIVEMHGGIVAVESEAGQGTTFSAVLPWKQ